MQKFAVRAFVLVLAITGAAATSVSKAATPSHAKIAMMTEPGSPTPLCRPGSGSVCGMD